MGPITGTGVLPAPVQIHFDQTLLARPMTNLIYRTFAMHKSLPSRSGRTMRFRRYNNFALATTPLSDNGLLPAPQQLSAVDIDATVDWYGAYDVITDQVTYLNEDPVLSENVSLMAQQYQETVDDLTKNVLAASASEIWCTQGGGIDNPTPISGPDIDDVIFTLINNKAKPITEAIEGTDQFGTTPIRQSYWGMAPSQVLKNLQNIDGFVAVNQYARIEKVLRDEWGAYNNARFLYSQNPILYPNASALGADVYGIAFTGKESHAVVSMDEASVEYIYTPPMDALRRLQYGGWKAVDVSRVLNDAWMCILKCILA